MHKLTTLFFFVKAHLPFKTRVLAPVFMDYTTDVIPLDSEAEKSSLAVKCNVGTNPIFSTSESDVDRFNG